MWVHTCIHTADFDAVTTYSSKDKQKAKKGPEPKTDSKAKDATGPPATSLIASAAFLDPEFTPHAGSKKRPVESTDESDGEAERKDKKRDGSEHKEKKHANEAVASALAKGKDKVPDKLKRTASDSKLAKDDPAKRKQPVPPRTDDDEEEEEEEEGEEGGSDASGVGRQPAKASPMARTPAPSKLASFPKGKSDKSEASPASSKVSAPAAAKQAEVKKTAKPSKPTKAKAASDADEDDETDGGEQKRGEGAAAVKHTRTTVSIKRKKLAQRRYHDDDDESEEEEEEPEEDEGIYRSGASSHAAPGSSARPSPAKSKPAKL